MSDSTEEDFRKRFDAFRRFWQVTFPYAPIHKRNRQQMITAEGYESLANRHKRLAEACGGRSDDRLKRLTTALNAIADVISRNESPDLLMTEELFRASEGLFYALDQEGEQFPKSKAEIRREFTVLIPGTWVHTSPKDQDS